MKKNIFKVPALIGMLLAGLLISGCTQSKPVFVQPAATPTAYISPTPEPATPSPVPATPTPEPDTPSSVPSTPTSEPDTQETVEFGLVSSGEETGSGSPFFAYVDTPIDRSTPEPSAEPEPAQATEAQTETAQASDAEPEPEATLVPETEQAESVTVGAVGDIMVMPSQHIAAYNEETGTYSFVRSFTAMTAMFQSTDLMCGNLEVCIAGEKAGYSNGVTDAEGRIRFNAPDEFAYDLKTVGFDVMTTANNHAGDCEAEGIINTIKTVKEAGLYQTGTYAEAADREVPLVIDVKGFKIGILSSTTVINGTSKLSHKQKDAMFSRLQYTEQIAHDIELLKNAGAEFIIMFAHWDKEYESKPQKSTRNYAKQLLEMGVDAVIGSHPHVVQPMTYLDVMREDGSSYTGLVAYSLGNFLSNMSGDCAYELFLQLELTRDGAGHVVLKDAAYMPVLCYPEEIETVDEKGNKSVETVHQVIPCLEDAGLLNCYNGVDDKKLAAMNKAREYVLKICGDGPVPVMEDACWIS